MYPRIPIPACGYHDHPPVLPHLYDQCIDVLTRKMTAAFSTYFTDKGVLKGKDNGIGTAFGVEE
jgi:hypothetical protein